MLVSAYDLRHNLLREPKRYFRNAEIVVIDSGGYELSNEFDSTEPKRALHSPLPFTESEYRQVLQGLPKREAYVIANFDWGSRGRSLKEQVRLGRNIFEDFPLALSDLILKPFSKASKRLNIKKVIAECEELRRFDVIGVTEKELGDNLVECLKNVATLRAALDSEGISAPIHIWGGLDPILTPLYFFVGAEIFDGVSWLRYAYHNGVAVYRDCLGLLDDSLGVDIKKGKLRAMAWHKNSHYLAKLSTDLRLFVEGKGRDFSMFGAHSDSFRRAYSALSTKIPELEGE